jgi:hypothetical protein
MERTRPFSTTVSSFEVEPRYVKSVVRVGIAAAPESGSVPLGTCPLAPELFA